MCIRDRGAVRGEAPARPLVEVVVGVDQAGRDQAPGHVDPGVPGGQLAGPAGADADDPAAGHHHVAHGVLGAGTVHSGHGAAVEHHVLSLAHRDSPSAASPGRPPGFLLLAASRTASRIFS